MRLAGAAGQPEHRTAHIAAPIGRTEADERRHQVGAATVGHLRGQCLAVTGAFDHAQPVAQPLHHRAGDEDRTFQCVLHPPVQAPGHGGQQAIARAHRLRTGVHQHEAAGAIGVLDHARLEAGLAEQCGLLVTGNAGDRNRVVEEELRPGMRVHGAGVAHLRQHRARDVEQGQQVVVPVQRVDVEQQGTRRVAVVGHMRLAAAEVPHQPAVDGAKQQLATLGALLRTFHVVEDPAHLGRGEIRIDQQARPFADQRFMPFGLQPLADGVALPRLPDDGVVDGLAGGAVPDHGGFALVGDAQCGDMARVDLPAAEQFGQRGIDAGEDLARVMLDPAGMREDLRELALCAADDVAGAVEQDRARTGGALVDGQHVAGRHAASPMAMGKS